MTDATLPPADELDVELDGDVDADVPEDVAGELSEHITIETPEEEGVRLDEVALDLVVANKELQEYKEAALMLMQTLDERQAEAEAAGNEQAAAVIGEVKESAHTVYLRLQRGDEELLGHRDGAYSGYLVDDE